jgi:hypothetical protein
MGTIVDIIDPAANDSSKDFTFNASVVLKWLFIKFVASATVGNRTLVLEVLDNAGSPATRYYVPLGPNVAASATRYFVLQPGVQHEASFGGPNSDHIHAPCIDGMLIREGWIMRIRDSAAVDAAADDMTVYGQAELV